MAPAMSAFVLAIVLVGIALELCVAWRLLRGGLWRVYPYFSLCMLFVVFRTFALYAVQRFAPGMYGGFYWKTDTVDIALRFLIVLEIFRHTFPRGSAVHGTAVRGVGVIAMGLAMFLVGTFWSFEAYAKLHRVYPALERSFGFVQAVMTLGILFIARYYGLELRRNIWGIAVAFGGWISVTTANNAMIDLDHSFLPYWQFVHPFSFIAMLGMWTWALWVFAPNPPIVAEGMEELGSDLSRWSEDWNRVVSTTRRAMHP